MRPIIVDSYVNENKSLLRYLAAKDYLDALRPKLSASEINAKLRQIEEAELMGPTKIIAIRFMSRKQLIAHYRKIEDGYKANFQPYFMRKTKWHRLRIPTLIYNSSTGFNTLPKNWKSIVMRAEELQKHGILSES